MAAGVLMATHEQADNRLGVPVDKRVYLRSWAFALDAKHLAARADLHQSAAMEVAAGAPVQLAGCDTDDIASFDLYSCFSAALGFAIDALGIAPTDASRPLTLTGGLPYHGGPSSNYMSHSIGYMIDWLRGRPGSMGLASGVGMHMTKHVLLVIPASQGSSGRPTMGRFRPNRPQAAALCGGSCGHGASANRLCYHRVRSPVESRVRPGVERPPRRPARLRS